jgi:hypothetical protein
MFDSCIWMQIPAGANTFSLVRNVQTVRGAHTASYSMGTSVFFPGKERPGREADHSHPSSAEVKNEWRYNSSPLCLHDLYRDGFSFYLN